MAENTNTEREALIRAITSMCHDMDNDRITITRREGEGPALRQLLDAMQRELASLSLPAAGQEPVARSAAERDELLQAAIDFIRTLTGMEPPPIEVAPPEVFAPFREFVDKVQAITNRYSVPQPAVPVERPCHVFTVRKSGALTEWEPTTMAFALPDGEHALYTITQPAVAAGWVSVEDRLPEHGQNVAFVVRVNSEGPFRRFNRRVLGGRFLMGEGFSVPGLCVDATHWMPLPTAPSTEGEARG